jgi:uncharacterized protein YkwD
MRKRMLALVLGVLTLGSGTPFGEGPACPAWTGMPGRRLIAQVEQELVQGVNAERAKRGLALLLADERLTTVARAYAAVLAQRGALSHTGPDGKEVAGRVKDAKIFDWSAVGENLASDSVYDHLLIDEHGRRVDAQCRQATELASVLVNGWIASPGHFANMVRPEFTHIGSGAAYAPNAELLYAVHVFATRVSCGFVDAPCCVAPGGRAVRCQEGLHCRGGKCRA